MSTTIDTYVETIKTAIAHIDARAAVAADPLHGLRSEITRRIINSRERKGISPGALAELMNDRGFDSIYRQTIQRIEEGTRQVRFDEAIALADIFGWSLDSFQTDFEITKLGSDQR